MRVFVVVEYHREDELWVVRAVTTTLAKAKLVVDIGWERSYIDSTRWEAFDPKTNTEYTILEEEILE